ncbi:hypothetical protein IFM89_011372 [Coptis chinensis]|uniref:BHLH domain-containing protein n=1 Tax=Coptis chinensis TaxID=261450 RepID=A0A835LV77_9MAGN|nr:hypothetical protein IFM89_011372 [Coptis chinensis]
METVGAMSEGERISSFGAIFSHEEASFMAQFVSNYPFPSEQDGGMSLDASTTFWPSHECTMNAVLGFDENLRYYQDNPNSNSYYFPRGSYSSSDSSIYLPDMGQENYHTSDPGPMLITDNSFMPVDHCIFEEQKPSLMTKLFPDNVVEEVALMNEELSSNSLEDSEGLSLNAVVSPDTKLHSKGKSETTESATATEDKSITISSENPKKRSRVSRYSSSCCNSEDDTNVSQEQNRVETSNSKESEALDSNGKTRASRGSATDPQSIYARKRRERINERLRILQNLVPNGTKVDISTMLEEAVQYVKFLQVQIKLLSSDDLWMYAPLAYNGMDIGLDLKISLPQ